MRTTIIASVSALALFSGLLAVLIDAQMRITILSDRLSESEAQVASLNAGFSELRKALHAGIDERTRELIDASQIPPDRDSPIDPAVLDQLRQQQGWVRDPAGTAGASTDAAVAR